MREFYIDFSATVIIKAKNEEEAQTKFWREWVPDGAMYVEVDTIEQIAEPPEKENP